MLQKGQREALMALCGSGVAFDVPMARFCTLRAGGRAAALVQIDDAASAASLPPFLQKERLPWRVIGRGSNILIRDEGFAGVLIRLAGALTAISSDRDGATVTVGGGCSLAVLLGYCRRHGLGGLEFLAGIPGSVGGAVRMNAGAFSQSIDEVLSGITVTIGDGTLQNKNSGQWRSGYRSFVVVGREMENIIVLQAELRIKRSSPEQVDETMAYYLQKRKNIQQPSMPSAGSFFKNPVNDYAGRLIEATGLKGLRVGGAMVSPEHANFIVNTGGATATDIIRLMRKVQEKVRAKTGIFLEPEVHII